MDKLEEKDAKVGSMFDKIHDAMWGSDPYFPVASPKPKFDQRAYRDENGLVRFYPSKKFMGFGMWDEDETGVEEGWEKHTRLSNEEAERIWNTRPEEKKGNQFALEYELKYDDDGSGLFIATFGEKKEEEMNPHMSMPPKRPTKPATVPYSGGNKPEPKLEWKVEELSSPGCTIRVSLVIDGVPSNCYVDNMGFSRSHFGNAKKMAKCVAKSKASILARYNLCKKESGRVEQ